MSSNKQLLAQATRLVPPLSSKLHKGQAGRVGILGGSKDYTGAPYYACYSAMKLGADLGHVICDPSAGAVIKTFSPDLIVHPVLEPSSSEANIKDHLTNLLPRLHVLVVGPGLGRDPYMQLSAKVALALCRENNAFVVLDADSLWLVGKEPEVVKGYKRAILTPNVAEFGRLCEALGVDQKKEGEDAARALSKALGGVTILQKGREDVITNGEEVIKGEEGGGLKRCGGQGDVLSGTVGTFLAWGKGYLDDGLKGDEERIQEERVPLIAAWAASSITRYCSRKAFEKKKRAMLTTDLLEEIGGAYEHFFGNVGNGEESKL
ncbi:carbohydrate kinase [Atractiella rhizophila]|nr:carbohydrate kinase [Atractiella rhizophila]